MGIKRLGRKRLAAIEKKGIIKNIGASDVMKNAIVSATQHREGQKLTTEIILDLGASAAALKTKALAANDPIGNGTGASYVAKITDAVFGHVVSVQTVCLEDTTDGTLTDYDLIVAGDGTLDGDVSSGNAGALGADGSAATDPQNITTLVANAFATAGQDNIVSVANADFAAEGLKNKFLYIVAGSASSQKGSALIDCTDVEISNLTNGVTTIRMISGADGATAVNIVADSSVNYDGSRSAGKFGIANSPSTAAHIAASIATALNASPFSAAVEATSKVRVTHATTTVTSNHDNFLIDDPQAASGITVSAFTGGLDEGQAISSGKLLIRIVGFVDFNDL